MHNMYKIAAHFALISVIALVAVIIVKELLKGLSKKLKLKFVFSNKGARNSVE